MKFRKLKAEEIECRISTIKEKGLSLLLYKTARVDAQLLDEEIGEGRWKNDFKAIEGVLYGGISIWDEDLKEWVTKWDCGVESYTEKDKGRASDAFKRAGFKWGIGRELYSAPFIWIPKGKADIQQNTNGKFYSYDRFSVKEIDYDDNGKICKLEIFNEKLKAVVFKMGEEEEEEKITRPSDSSIKAKLTTAGFGNNWKKLLVANYNIEIKEGMSDKEVFALMTDEQMADCEKKCLEEIAKKKKKEQKK